MGVPGLKKFEESCAGAGNGFQGQMIWRIKIFEMKERGGVLLVDSEQRGISTCGEQSMHTFCAVRSFPPSHSSPRQQCVKER